MLYNSKLNGISHLGPVQIEDGLEICYFQRKDRLEIKRIKDVEDLKRAVRQLYLTELNRVTKEVEVET